MGPNDQAVALYPRRRRYKKPIERPWDWVYTMWSPKTRERIRRERRNKRQAWTDLWYSGVPRGLAVGSVVLAVGVVVLITVLVPIGLVGGGICVRDLGCAWSDSQGVRIAPTDQPVTVSTR
jgi:hypothetical protein